MSQPTFSDNDAIGELLKSYTLQSGAADELLDAAGQIRPVWLPFVEYLAQRSPKQLQQDFLRGDQYLRDAGVFFREYDEGPATERDWPLSHIPLLIEESEFQHISASLIERADLLETVVADLYGENELVAQGHLPAELIADNPEWLRPLVGIEPAGGRYLNFIAFEIGRGPDGQWWVLSDRTDSPAGAGFAIENRVATTRVYSEKYSQDNVFRLATFFRKFRDTLYGMRQDPTSRIGVLSSGPDIETYFEHAYIARYLGFLLLEGEDLATENGKLMLRTVSGLRPIDVLWRRLDSDQADPLELDGKSQSGVPGLLNAVRQKELTLVNALGSGVLQSRAFLAFLPRLQKTLNGTPLSMPNVAMWWCGEENARARVIQNGAHMMIGSAHSTRLPFDENDDAVSGSSLGTPADLAAYIERDPAKLTAQEIVTLSTTPAFLDGALVPRPMTLRVFLARTEEGWTVMPGGFARIGQTECTTAVGMQRGGRVADTWIVSKSVVDTETMLPVPGAALARPKAGALPSRASENLYWLGRYVERSESMIRLVRAYHVRLAEAAGPKSPLLTHAAAHFKGYGINPTERVPVALHKALSSAVNSASRIRERFSIDGWIALNEMTQAAKAADPDVHGGDDTARAMGALLRQLAGFSGLVRENMYRFTGWRFLSMGRAVERAANMSAALAHFADPKAPQGALDFVIELGDSAMSHRRLYSVATSRETVVQILALDTMNPRSVMHQLDEILEHVKFLSADSDGAVMTALARAALQEHTGLIVKTPELIDTDALIELSKSINHLSALVSTTHLR
jgi:uncharacterized circularly permuted ATP-grasp superfamily protein/uncharacterized alpha-E superfamily protein